MTKLGMAYRQPNLSRTSLCEAQPFILSAVTDGWKSQLYRASGLCAGRPNRAACVTCFKQVARSSQSRLRTAGCSRSLWNPLTAGCTDNFPPHGKRAFTRRNALTDVTVCFRDRSGMSCTRHVVSRKQDCTVMHRFLGDWSK
jgi:hypothetical protein